MIIFPITIFISAFLLFQVQPLISRYILPWFGGSPAVWSAAMLFFQTLLLVGYAYAHWLRSLKSRQTLIHLSILSGAAAFILVTWLVWGTPLLVDRSLPLDVGDPFWNVMFILIISVGLPYFVLSTTSPLVQAWFERAFRGRSPYWLYALSNAGSFLALISYPFLVEPALRLSEQAYIWVAAFGIYLVLYFWLAVRWGVQNPAHQEVQDANHPPVEAKALLYHRLMWLALPAVTSILLLSFTNQLTQEVAVVPFLWILPLSIYLLSFVITFSSSRVYPRTVFIFLLGAATLLIGYGMYRIETIGMIPQILIFSFFLLMGTLVGHGELYRLRPAANQLTMFYLMISLGGAIGGVFVNLIAPYIFEGYWELHLGVGLCWLLLLILLVAERDRLLFSRAAWATVPFLLVVAGLTGYAFNEHVQNMLRGVMYMERNFYGVSRVRLLSVGENGSLANSLSHGITAHGFQFIEPKLKTIPTTYFGRRSGIGITLVQYPRTLPDPAANIKVGIIGLGSGTLAAYGREGDVYRFYEINPDMIALAEGHGGFFTYLEDSPAAIELVAGDARLMMEDEFEAGDNQQFDILALDAFTGDAIPVHLLTLEAFKLYLDHLKPEGVLAVHISNRYLDLVPLVQTLADAYGLPYTLIRSGRDEPTGAYPAVWMLLSHNQAFHRSPVLVVQRDNLTPVSGYRPWTDDYSNLLPYLKMELALRWR